MGANQQILSGYGSFARQDYVAFYGDSITQQSSTIAYSTTYRVYQQLEGYATWARFYASNRFDFLTRGTGVDQVTDFGYSGATPYDLANGATYASVQPMAVLLARSPKVVVDLEGTNGCNSQVATWSPTVAAASISNASPAVVTKTSHGLANGTRVQLTTSGTLPAGLSTGTDYYVVNKATNTFQLSLTVGGAAINTSSAGSGTHNYTNYAYMDNLIAQRIANWDYMLANGVTRVVALAVPPIGTGSETSAILTGQADAANAVWQAACASRNVSWVAYPSSFKSGGSQVGTYFRDSLHPNVLGAQTYGALVATALDPYVNMTAFAAPSDNSARWKTTNPGLTGSGTGTRPTGFTGSGDYDLSITSLTIASPCVVTKNNHGLANGCAVKFITGGGDTLPTGFSFGTTYYVVNSATNTFQLSATPGGAAINTSGSQSGSHTVTVMATITVSKVTDGQGDWTRMVITGNGSSAVGAGEVRALYRGEETIAGSTIIRPVAYLRMTGFKAFELLSCSNLYGGNKSGMLENLAYFNGSQEYSTNMNSFEGWVVGPPMTVLAAGDSLSIHLWLAGNGTCDVLKLGLLGP